MEASRKAATMTAEDFTAALAALGWKQADFARRAGIGDEAVSRWARGSVRVAPWVRSYLGMATALHELHRQFVEPTRCSAGVVETGEQCDREALQ